MFSSFSTNSSSTPVYHNSMCFSQGQGGSQLTLDCRWQIEAPLFTNTIAWGLFSKCYWLIVYICNIKHKKKYLEYFSDGHPESPQNTTKPFAMFFSIPLFFSVAETLPAVLLSDIMKHWARWNRCGNGPLLLLMTAKTPRLSGMWDYKNQTRTISASFLSLLWYLKVLHKSSFCNRKLPIRKYSLHLNSRSFISQYKSYSMLE